MLLPTVLDFIALDGRVSVGLLGLHVGLMWLGLRVGGGRGSGMCYGVTGRG